METNQKKFLVIRMSSLGDIILTAPVYKNIKEKYPDSYISLIVKPQFKEALASNPYIDEIITFTNLFSVVKKIRQENFTHLLDLHNNLRSFLIKLFVKIPNVSTYKKYSFSRKLFVKFRFPNPVLEKHSLEKYLNSLEKFDIPIKFKELEFEDWKYNNKKEKSGKKTKKIAILQTAFLGDTVLTAPLIKETAKIFPDAKISVITRPETKEIFKPLKEVSEIIIYDKHKISKIKGILEIAKKIEKKKFNIIIVPHRSFTSALIAYLSKTKIRVGFSSSAGKFLYTKTAPFSWMMHDSERNLSLLKTLTDENQNINKEISIYTPQEKISNKFKVLEVDKKLVAIHPGSVWLTKRWFPERYAKVIEELENNFDVKTVLIGGKSDSKLAKEIIELSNVKPIDLTGKTTLSDLMNIMPKFKLFITNDSGPMHIACAYKVPTLAIFGPTTKELGFFPYAKNSKVLEIKDLKCRPCTLHGGKKCPRGHFLCMKLITKDMVIDLCKEMLAS